MLAVMAGYFRLHRDRSFSVSTVQPSLDENPAENGGSQERKPPMPRHPSRLVAHGRHEDGHWQDRSEEHTSELQSLMRISYAVFCLKKKNTHYTRYHTGT